PQRGWQPGQRDHALQYRADPGPRLGRQEQPGARAAVGEVQRPAQGSGGALAIVVPHDRVRGPVAAAPLPPGAGDPGDIETGAVVLVQRLLHDVGQPEGGLEAAQAQAPRGFAGAVLEVGLVDGGLAVLQARGTWRVVAQPESGVGLVGIQPRGHAATGMPAAAQLPACPQSRAGTEAVRVRHCAAAGPCFGADIAKADVAAGLPAIAGVRTADCEEQCEGQGAGYVHVGVPAAWVTGIV